MREKDQAKGYTGFLAIKGFQFPHSMRRPVGYETDLDRNTGMVWTRHICNMQDIMMHQSICTQKNDI